MPSSRLVSVLAAAALTIAPLALAAPADAGAAPVARVLPKRTITSDVVKVKGKLILHGNVSPDYARQSVDIQKRKCAKCAWKPFDKVTTTAKGNYRVRIYAPRKGAWFWRAKVRASGGYGTSYSGVWKTYVI